MGRLAGRVAVVTGAGSGLGEGIVRLFAEEGARVVVSNRDVSKAEAVAASINEAGGVAVAFRADVGIERDCRDLVDCAVAHFGQLDILVNTVGYSARGTIEDTSVELWDEVFALNVRSSFICTQQAVKHMKERRYGSIINIGSVNAYIGEPKLMAYSASKGALMTLTRNLASYLNRYQIRINQLNVGWTLTPNEHHVKVNVEGKGDNCVEEAVKSRPWGRLLLPQDIAHAALYFASIESELITGTVMDMEQYPVGAPPNW